MHLILISTLALFAMLFFHCWKYIKSSGPSMWRTVCLFWRGIMTLRHLSFVIALALFAFAPIARVKADPNFITVTNQPAIVTTTASSNILSWVKCNSQSGVAIHWQFNQTSASTSNATLVVYSSVDGTNVSTVPFASLTAPSTGATDVLVDTNWSAAQLSAFDSLIIGKIQNSTALTSLTNKAIIVRRSPF